MTRTVGLLFAVGLIAAFAATPRLCADDVKVRVIDPDKPAAPTPADPSKSPADPSKQPADQPRIPSQPAAVVAAPKCNDWALDAALQSLGLSAEQVAKLGPIIEPAAAANKAAMDEAMAGQKRYMEKYMAVMKANKDGKPVPDSPEVKAL